MHQAYKDAICAADERTVDSVGVWFALRFRGYRTQRLTGVDLAEGLIREAAARGWKVAFFGGETGVAEQAAAVWRHRCPGLDIRAWSGGVVGQDGTEDGLTWEDREDMTRWRPDLILCALGGGGTRQERWIARHRDTFVGCRAIVGVGGAFDMWAGRLPRAPRLMRSFGLEWLWRWILQPTRWKRMWRATAVFAWRVFQEKR